MLSESNRLRPTIYAVNLPPVGRGGEESGSVGGRRRSGSARRSSGKFGQAGWPEHGERNTSNAGGPRGSRTTH